LAVGEIQGLLKQAKYAQLGMVYKLTRDFEVLRLQCYKLLNYFRAISFGVESYGIKDMLRTPLYVRFGKWFSNTLARELFAEELVEEPTDDNTEQQMNILQDIHHGVQKLVPPHSDHCIGTKVHRIKKKS
jgi:hypothetical protein